MEESIRVLMVEDSEDDAQLILRQMKKGGFDPDHERVETAEAMRTALREKSWDVILSDYSMPQFSGLAAIALMKETGIEAPLIIVSGAIGEETAVKAIVAGAHDYILKGNLSRLVPAIVRALEDAESLKKRQQAEHALREAEESYRAVFNGGAQGILVADMESKRFVQANPAMCNMLGYTEQELTHLGVEDIHPKKSLDHVMAASAPQTQGDAAVMHTVLCLRKDGTVFYADFATAPCVINGHICTVGFALDITDRKRAESEQKRLTDQLRQSQKMEAIGTLAGGIAHDFNNILTSIIGNAHLALMDIENKGPLREEIEEIKASGERAATLTRQLLAFSRKQIIQPKILDLNELLTGIEKMLGRLIREDVELLINFGPELWQVKADLGQMEQTIMNLAVNAKDAMPKGGKLTIETSNVDLDGSFFRERAVLEEKPGAYVMISISDTGSGMDKNTQEHIFEPFFTTKEIGKGTGLGLATVYGIVKQNKGFIWVDSEPGHGSIFKIYLPRARGDVAPIKERTSAIELGGSETILIVEDDDNLRKLVQKVFRGLGYKVLVAENGQNAIEIVIDHDGPIDLILTDVVMPKMGGTEVVKRLQPLYPQMKVIYMSGYTDKAIAHHDVLTPGLNFIEKPFSPKGLVRQVRQTLNTQ